MMCKLSKMNLAEMSPLAQQYSLPWNLSGEQGQELCHTVLQMYFHFHILVMDLLSKK